MTLADELTFIRGYLEIQQIRFEDRIRVTFDIEERVLSAMIPSLILQPIVENAMMHGCGRSVSGGELRLAATREDSAIVIRVQDSGSGQAVASFREGIGLSNTRDRLATLYGDRGRLHLSTLPAGGALVELSMPYRRRDE